MSVEVTRADSRRKAGERGEPEWENPSAEQALNEGGRFLPDNDPFLVLIRRRPEQEYSRRAFAQDSTHDGVGRRDVSNPETRISGEIELDVRDRLESEPSAPFSLS